MKRKIILILTSIAIVVTAIYFYIDTVFLPIQLKQYIIKKAEKYLNRQVTIDTIDFKPIKGFIVKNITIARKDIPQEPFIQIQEITFNLLLAPFFQKRTLIIPNVTINEPIITIARHKDRTWNFSDLLDLKNEAKRRKLPVVLLRKLNLEGGEIIYRDKTQKKEFTEYISNINLDTTLSLNKGIRFVVEASAPKHKASVKIKGNYSLLAKKLTAQVLLNEFPVAQYLSLIPLSQPFIQINDGVISSADLGLTYQNHEFQIQGAFVAANTDLDIGETKKMTGLIDVSNMLFTWGGKKWKAKGRIKIPSVSLSAASGRELQGNITADLNLFTIHEKNITIQGDVIVDNAHLKIDEKTFLKGNVTASNASLSLRNDTIHLKGNLDIKEAFISIDGQASVGGSLQTTKTELVWNAPDDKGNRKLTVQSGFKMDPAQITLKANRSMSGVISVPKANLVFEHKKITVEAQGQINKANVHLTADQQLHGDPHFNIFYQFDPKKTNPVDYKSTLHFAKSQLTGIPYLNEVNQLEGIVTITPDNIQTDKLTFTMQDTTVLLSGVLTNFVNPVLDIKASLENVQLQTFFTVFPILGEKINANIIGQVDIKASYKGLVSSPTEADIELTAQVTDTLITHDSLDHDIAQVSGLFEYKKDLLKWSNLYAEYKDTSYQVFGQLSNFSRPIINAKIISDQFELSTQIKILNQAFQFTSLVGHYLNSQFDLKGDVHLFEDAEPDIDLRGKFEIDLKDIGVLVPRLKHRVEQFRPSGIVTGEGIFRGKLNDWRNWQMTFDAISDNITILDYPFEKVSLRFDQRDLNISRCDMSSRIYGGELTVVSSVDLIDEEAPFTSKISLEKLDLKQFREDRKPKNELLAGNLSLSILLNGSVMEWRQLTGNGSLHITDGYLWQWNILDGISGILLIPEFQTLAFTDAHGDFFIHDQKIFTENARMISKTTTLDGKGWIDFNKNLNFNIKPTFSELTILQSDSIKKGLTSIITQTKDYLNIKLTGTLDNPKHSVEKFPIKIIEETIGGATGTLKEVIGSIINEIF